MKKNMPKLFLMISMMTILCSCSWNDSYTTTTKYCCIFNLRDIRSEEGKPIDENGIPIEDSESSQSIKVTDYFLISVPCNYPSKTRIEFKYDGTFTDYKEYPNSSSEKPNTKETGTYEIFNDTDSLEKDILEMKYDSGKQNVAKHSGLTFISLPYVLKIKNVDTNVTLLYQTHLFVGCNLQ